MSEVETNKAQMIQPPKRRAKKQYVKNKKACPFSGPNAFKVDYKDLKLLQKFISDSGKILPSRITSVSTKHQRHLGRAIKRARFLALLPYRSLD
ncbi:MAG: 30S ribosomal protein S18 [Alphaproteobacteria bacterium]|nr:MAG: 30S ribosomal protein S18 [Alphaproteobacteria bacterium]